MQAALFFIAIIPGPALCAEVTHFKEYAATHFGSSRALRSPPHITLVPPFKWQENRLEELSELLSGFAGEEEGFPLSLSGFDCFAPRVIYVNVVENSSLSSLQSRLGLMLTSGLGLQKRDDRPYHPHMTVAFKDLRRSVFPKAWTYFSSLDYERRFQVDCLTLLQHNGRMWEIFRDFPFRS